MHDIGIVIKSHWNLTGTFFLISILLFVAFEGISAEMNGDDGREKMEKNSSAFVIVLNSSNWLHN